MICFANTLMPIIVKYVIRLLRTMTNKGIHINVATSWCDDSFIPSIISPCFLPKNLNRLCRIMLKCMISLLLLIKLAQKFDGKYWYMQVVVMIYENSLHLASH